MNHSDVVDSRFALIASAIKTILALPTMKDLDISIHLASNTIRSRGDIYEILALEEKESEPTVASDSRRE